MMRIPFAAGALAALAFSSAHAQGPSAPYEIVHPGDSALPCDAMAREIAGLGTEIQSAKAAAQQQQVAEARAVDQKRAVRGLGGAMFSQAAAFGIGRIPMSGLIANPVLMQGLAHAAAAGSQAIASGGATPAQAAAVAGAASVGPEQRQAYLVSLFKSKSC